MLIKIGNLTLASNTAAVGDNYAPAGNVEMDCESMMQDSRTIGSASRKLYNRGNAAGRLSFTVRPRYATLAAAAEGAATIAACVDTKDTLTLTPSPETGAASLTKTGAVVRRVKTRQVGVTVEAQYEIEF